MNIRTRFDKVMKIKKSLFFACIFFYFCKYNINNIAILPKLSVGPKILFLTKIRKRKTRKTFSPETIQLLHEKSFRC